MNNDRFKFRVWDKLKQKYISENVSVTTRLNRDGLLFIDGSTIAGFCFGTVLIVLLATACAILIVGKKTKVVLQKKATCNTISNNARQPNF